MPIDPETQAEFDRMEMQLKAAREAAETALELVDNLMANGLDALLFQSLFPQSTTGGGVATAGDGRQAARSDHSH